MGVLELCIRAEHEDATGPTRLRAREQPSDVLIGHLAPGTAAVVTRLYGRVYVSISELVPADLAAGIVRHVIDEHHRGCFSADCALARGWIGSQSSPERAALPA